MSKGTSTGNGRHRWRKSRVTGGVGVLAAVLAGAASAAASPTLTVSRPCVTRGEHVDLAGSGFTPNGSLQVVLGVDSPHVHQGAVVPLSLIADSTGALPAGAHLTFEGLVSTDDLEETLTVTVIDQTRIQAGMPPGPETAASAQLKASVFVLFVSPWLHHHVNPRATTTFLGLGLEPATQLYAFYVLHGKVVKRVKLGAVTGPCGTVVRKMHQFPFRPVPAGDYSVYIAPSATTPARGRVLAYKHLRVTKAKAVR